MKKKPAPKIIELNSDQVAELLEHSQAALSAEDFEKLKALIESYAWLTEMLKQKGTTLERLRKLLFGSSSEKTRDVIKPKEGAAQTPAASSAAGGASQTEPGASSPMAPTDGTTASAPTDAESAPGKRKGHGRNGADAYQGAEKIQVPHACLKPGDPCPDCKKGTVYEQNQPAVMVRFTGQAPLQAKIYELQRLRCNLCLKVFTAAAPEGVGDAKYDAPSASMIALLKYGSGLPFNRLEGLQGSLGLPLPASTQWEIVEDAARKIGPVYEELIRQAAAGEVLHNDDTKMKILELMGKRAEKRALAQEAAPGGVIAGEALRDTATPPETLLDEVLVEDARRCDLPDEVCAEDLLEDEDAEEDGVSAELGDEVAAELENELTADDEDQDSAPAKVKPPRTGIFTSGIVSTNQGRQIALYFTGRQHAGENLADVLAHRPAELAPPIQMCDALSRNMPKPLATLLANCLAHGRRQFVDVVKHFPDQCRHVLETLREVYKNDDMARERNLSPQERLVFHRAHSGKRMGQLKGWMIRQLEQHRVEPNSGLGQAIRYMLKHWKKLVLFLRVPGAPLDNNLCERILKLAILHRKNALFYLTQHGAHVGDVFMSLIHTCRLSRINPFDYLTALQRHADELSATPQAWMPWNYPQAVKTSDSP